VVPQWLEEYPFCSASANRNDLWYKQDQSGENVLQGPVIFKDYPASSGDNEILWQWQR
jgi:hypothetical protein